MSTEGSSFGSVVNERLSISFKPYGTIQFTKRRTLRMLRPGVFYVPKSSDQEAFDSFTVADRVLYIFQFTIADRHSIKGGLVDFFSRKSFQPILRGMEWRFIFVIPQGNDIVCPESTDARMKEFWEGVELFSAEIDPAKQE